MKISIKSRGKIDFLSGIGYNEIGDLDLRGEKDTMKTKKAKRKTDLKSFSTNPLARVPGVRSLKIRKRESTIYTILTNLAADSLY